MQFDELGKLLPLLLMLALWIGRRMRRRERAPRSGPERRARRVPGAAPAEFERDYEPIEPRRW